MLNENAILSITNLYRTIVNFPGAVQCHKKQDTSIRVFVCIYISSIGSIEPYPRQQFIRDLYPILQLNKTSQK